MKKLFLAAVSVCLLCAAAFAQDMPLDAETKADLSARAKILLKDVNKHQEKIQKIAIELPYQERLSLYNKEKKETLGPVAINVFSFLVGIPPNLGIGSFAQKDIAGGVIHLGTGLIGTGCAVGGCLSLLISKKPEEYAIPLLVAGGAISLGSWIFGIVRPITYASKYNRRLEQALLLNDAQMSIVPLAVPNGQFGLAVSVRY